MDADLQHPPEKIKDIAKKLRLFDIVIATRKKIKKWSFSRRLVSKVAIFFGSIRLLFKGIIVKDPVSGFFGIKTHTLNLIVKKYEKRFEKTGYKILFDILKYSRKPKIGIVYYDFCARKYGNSKIGKKHIISYMKSLFK